MNDEDFKDLSPHDSGNRMLTPEERLWLYVLFDAVERWREGDRLAYQWLFNDPAQSVGSAAWVFHVLGIDGSGFRDKLRQAKCGLDFFGRSVSRIVGDL